MKILVEWDEKHDDIIIYHFPDKWNWNDFLVAFDEEMAMAAENPERPYFVIGDVLNSQRLPPGSAITQMHKLFDRYPPNWQSTIILTPSTLVRSMYTIGARMYPNLAKRIQLTNGYDKAYAMIAALRGTSPE